MKTLSVLRTSPPLWGDPPDGYFPAASLPIEGGGLGRGSGMGGITEGWM